MTEDTKRRNPSPREEAVLDLIYERMSRRMLASVSVNWLPAWVLVKEAAEDERKKNIADDTIRSAGGYDITDHNDLQRMAAQIIDYLCAHGMMGFTSSPTDPSRAPVAFLIEGEPNDQPAVNELSKT